MKMREFRMSAVGLAALLLVLVSPECLAQQGYGSANTMWGTSSGGAGGYSQVESALAHQSFGVGASQVELAKNSMSINNITIMSIGSQNIVSVTGDNNTTTSDQKASTRGDVQTQSDIAISGAQ
jgi:hypothetical protein